MVTPNRPFGSLHRPSDVARILGCSEWWVKEQARKRRIPFAWIGGSYRFTDEHIAQIIALFEVQPDEYEPSPATATHTVTTRIAPDVALKSRPPRRVRKGQTLPDTAA